MDERRATDRRQSTRFSTRLEVSVEVLPDLDDGDRTTQFASERFLAVGGDKKITGTLHNISRHGVLIASRSCVPLRSRVRIVFESRDEESVAVTGLVIWTRKAESHGIRAGAGERAMDLPAGDGTHWFAVLFEHLDAEVLRFIDDAMG